MKLKTYRSFIFDFDGTLVDSMGLWHAIDHMYLGRYGIPCPEGLSHKISGKTFRETALFFKENFDLPDTIETIIDDWHHMAYDLYMEDVPFKPGVPELIETLRSLGCSIAIATSNSRELTTAYLKHHHAEHWFDAMSFTGELQKGKPDPTVFLHAAKQVLTPPDKCMGFEDTKEGIRGLIDAGMTAVAVEDQHQGHQRQKILKLADYYIDDYYQLLEEVRYEYSL